MTHAETIRNCVVLNARGELTDPGLITDLCNDAAEVMDELSDILRRMDELADIWGDEGNFRRLRDRVRELVGESE